MPADKKYIISILLILLASSLWGCTGLMTRPLMEDFGLRSLDITGARMLVGGITVVMFALLFKRDIFAVKRKDLWIFAIIGFSRFTTLALFVETQDYIDLEIAVAFEMISPLFVILLSVPIFRQSITFKKVLVIALLLLGSGTLTGIFVDTGISMTGVGYGLLTAASMSVFVISSKAGSDRGYGPLTLLAYMFIFGCILMLPFVNLGNIAHTCMDSQTATVYIVLLGVVFTAVSYYIFFMGIRNVTATVASILEVAEIVVSTLVGVFFFNEIFTLRDGVGISIIVFAVILLSIEMKKLEFDLYAPKPRKNDGVEK